VVGFGIVAQFIDCANTLSTGNSSSSSWRWACEYKHEMVFEHRDLIIMISLPQLTRLRSRFPGSGLVSAIGRIQACERRLLDGLLPTF
jgi:hypothetical protein